MTEHLLLVGMLGLLGGTLRAANPTNLVYIDTSFENASPLWYEPAPDGAVLVHLLYDHERGSPNRAAGHIHFRLEAAPGARLTLEFKNLDNVWNGRPGSVAKELKTIVVSSNGRDWTPVPTDALPENRVQITLEMPGPYLLVARLEPYTAADLDRLLDAIRTNPLVQITPIGKTVEGRPLEIIRVGNPQAPHRVFLRARAHPWESGGNWVVEGLIRRLLEADPHARECLERYCVDILNQTAAIRSALRGVERLLIEDHARSCMEDAIQSGDQDRQRAVHQAAVDENVDLPQPVTQNDEGQCDGQQGKEGWKDDESKLLQHLLAPCAGCQRRQTQQQRH